MSSTFYHHLQELLDEGLTVAVATITDVKGSVPREVGAKMIVHPLGQHIGTIGGGCGGVMNVFIEQWSADGEA